MTDRRVTADLDGDGKILFDIASGEVTDERSLRAEADRDNATARRTWNELDDRRRAALVSLVSEALTELAGNVEAWLEGSLIARSNEKIGISVLFKLGNLDDQIIRMRSVNEAERLARINDLARIAGGPVAAAG